MKNPVLGALCASLLITDSGAVNAALVKRLGGLAYYDDIDGLSWLADTRLATSNIFEMSTTPISTITHTQKINQTLKSYQGGL